MKYFLLPLLAMALGAGGCVDDDLSMTIELFVGITEDDECQATVQDGNTKVGLTRGLLDTQLKLSVGSSGYILVPQVINNQAPTLTSTSAASTDPGSADIERNSIDIVGFDVQLQPPEDTPLGAALPTSDREYFVPAAGGRLLPGGMSEAAVPIVAVPASVVQVMDNGLMSQSSDALAPPRPLLIHIRPVGTRAGLKLNGGWVDFPLDVCRGCLLPVDTTCGVYAANSIHHGCLPGQDGDITCCDNGGDLLCGDQVPQASQ